MSDCIEKFNVLCKMKKEFLNEIKNFYIFKDSEQKSNVFLITNDDKVFAFGYNVWGVLGFGDLNEVNELRLNEKLSYKRIIDIKNGWYHVVARTTDGKVYCWGSQAAGKLGNGKIVYKICEPFINDNLCDKQITDICCGSDHTLVLTNNGEVYAWGWNEFGQIGMEAMEANQLLSN
jgi:RCC1 and BTB domain-containing protein